jgi:hypothetical protein
MWTDPGNIKIAHSHMNLKIGTEVAHFPEKEYINGIFVAVCLLNQHSTAGMCAITGNAFLYQKLPSLKLISPN